MACSWHVHGLGICVHCTMVIVIHVRACASILPATLHAGAYQPKQTPCQYCVLGHWRGLALPCHAPVCMCMADARPTYMCKLLRCVPQHWLGRHLWQQRTVRHLLMMVGVDHGNGGGGGIRRSRRFGARCRLCCGVMRRRYALESCMLQSVGSNSNK